MVGWLDGWLESENAFDASNGGARGWKEEEIKDGMSCERLNQEAMVPQDIFNEAGRS